MSKWTAWVRGQETPEPETATETGTETDKGSRRFGRGSDKSTEQTAESAEVPEGHRSGARPSTQEKHEKGNTRRGKDKRGGEKGDSRRSY
ncbi:hypothetical protein AB0L70_23635 [Kribbella sp. NPDC051952]|jgi:hypothetical protein|uniref:hypothetical protein n=1 Tax=Kribbella sp. NPDC051952 TaxID=3154851 RepID=UPI00341BF17F